MTTCCNVQCIGKASLTTKIRETRKSVVAVADDLGSFTSLQHVLPGTLDSPDAALNLLLHQQVNAMAHFSLCCPTDLTAILSGALRPEAERQKRTNGHPTRPQKELG